MKFSRKLYGLDRLAERLEKEIFLSKETPDLYKVYTSYQPRGRAELLRRIKKIITRELLSKEFRLAIARDILREEGVALETELYKFIKTRLYRGNLRAMLSDLQEELDKDVSI